MIFSITRRRREELVQRPPRLRARARRRRAAAARLAHLVARARARRAPRRAARAARRVQPEPPRRDQEERRRPLALPAPHFARRRGALPRRRRRRLRQRRQRGGARAEAAEDVVNLDRSRRTRLLSVPLATDSPPTPGFITFSGSILRQRRFTSLGRLVLGAEAVLGGERRHPLDLVAEPSLAACGSTPRWKAMSSWTTLHQSARPHPHRRRPTSIGGAPHSAFGSA